ncbi:hypothetical protein JCM15519_05280 [Fundidesulfovibrio butyratiphilus]
MERNEIETMRQATMTYYRGESVRLERQALETLRLAGRCLEWAENIRFLPDDGVMHVYDVMERGKRRQARDMARMALETALDEANT